MPCPLNDLLERLRDALAGSPARLAKLPPTPAEERRLPLVHRTGYPTQDATLNRILVDGHLRPPKQPTQNEKDFELDPAVYFFHGAGAYPHGIAAFLVATETLEEGQYPRATFTPFDTGGLIANPPHLKPSGDNIPNWSSIKVRKAFLENHQGYAKDFHYFAECYRVTHFFNLHNYIRWPWKSDWPAYHGLVNENGDCRSCRPEIRIPEQVSFDDVEAILLDGQDLQRRVSDDHLRLVVVVEDHSDSFGHAIAKYVENKYC